MSNSKYLKIRDQNRELNQKEIRSKALMLESYPIRLDISITNRCNLKCIYCQHSYYSFNHLDEMTIDTFLLFEEIFPYLSNATLFNTAEPLIAKDFDRIFSSISSYPVETYISTNGILLDRNRIQLLVSKRLDYLTFSINGFNRETYHKYHGADCFENLEANISQLRREKKNQSSEEPRLRNTFVLMNDNFNELKRAIEFASKYEFEEGVNVNILIAHSKEMVPLLPVGNSESLSTRLAELRDYAKGLCVTLSIQGEKRFQQELTKTKKYCYEPWQRVSIDFKGDVRPCSVAETVIGNIHRNYFKEIWNSKIMLDYRKRVNTDNPPEDCWNCWHCRNRGSNSLAVLDLSERTNLLGGIRVKA